MTNFFVVSKPVPEYEPQNCAVVTSHPHGGYVMVVADTEQVTFPYVVSEDEVRYDAYAEAINAALDTGRPVAIDPALYM